MPAALDFDDDFDGRGVFDAFADEGGDEEVDALSEARAATAANLDLAVGEDAAPAQAVGQAARQAAEQSSSWAVSRSSPKQPGDCLRRRRQRRRGA
jgi:hypothetical protein